MAVRIIPRIIRGRVFYQIADVLIPTLAQAARAWSAAVTQRLLRCAMGNLHELLQQTEPPLNRSEGAEALCIIAQVKQHTDDQSQGDAEPKLTIPERIEALSSDLFGIQSTGAVTREAIDRDKGFDRHSVLDRVYDELDVIATEMESIAGDVRRSVSVIGNTLLVSP